MAHAIRLVLIALVVTTAVPARAQTTGGISGVVRDSAEGGAPLPGATVVVTSAKTGAVQYAETDENGAYEMTNLDPGVYSVLFKFVDVTVRSAEVIVRLGKVTPMHAKINTDLVGKKGEIVDMHGKAPTVDVGSTKQSTSVGREYFDTVPVPGRTWAESTGIAPGSAGDLYGVGFSGSSSLESRQIIDGVDTTGLNFGEASDSLITDFLEEMEIITGGYNAEYGRSTGGIVTAVTKTGGNAWHGSVFATGTTAAFTASSRRAAEQQTSLEADVNLAYDADMGVEVGGPILKDKLFFYGGLSPQFRKFDVERVTQRRVDRDQNGQPDVDDNGFFVYEELDRQTIADTSTSYQYLGKINYVLDASNQGQISASGTPTFGTRVGIRGEPSATRRSFSRLTTDVGAKWTSKLNDNRTQIEAVLGWHRVGRFSESIAPETNGIPGQNIVFADLSAIGLDRESNATLDGCRNAGLPDDDYPLIPNCPDDGFGYAIGGIGALQDDTEERRSLKLAGSHRVRAAGHHVLKAGADVEDNRATVPRHFTGDAFYTVFLQNQLTAPRIEANRYVTIDALGDNQCGFAEGPDGSPDPDQPIRCDYLSGAGPVTGHTVNWSAFVQDSWSIRPNFTLNAGLRYEEQRLRYAKELQNSIDPITGDNLGKNALVMNNMWAPRLGVIYDPTKQGRSKMYGHWGRFYESIPMRINERSFGGETFLQSIYDIGQCGDPDPTKGNGPDPLECDPDESPALGYNLFGAGTIVAPGVKPQYMDEVLAGVEYELLEDLRVGAAYKNRRLGRVLEDVSTDNADTYVIANPGEFDVDEENKLRKQIDALDADDPLREKLEHRLELFQGIRQFDKAKRDYNAVELIVNKRFSGRLFVQAAYTYSRTNGNFPGLFSPETGQLDPNITSQFDLVELMSNRDGPLPQDRPHYFKFDGSYRWDLGRAGMLTTGARFRALSGTPIDALGTHYLYGRGETYLIPRGSVGRTPFDNELDLRVRFTRKIGRGMAIELWADVFNVLNNQSTILVDEEYTLDPTLPISGGSMDDLVYLKRTDFNSGVVTPNPATRKQNFRNTSQRLTPMSARFGARLTF
jgi:hypothetical protein